MARIKILDCEHLEIVEEVWPEGLLKAIAVEAAQALEAVPEAKSAVISGNLLELLVHCGVEARPQEMRPEAEQSVHLGGLSGPNLPSLSQAAMMVP